MNNEKAQNAYQPGGAPPADGMMQPQYQPQQPLGMPSQTNFGPEWSHGFWDCCTPFDTCEIARSHPGDLGADIYVHRLDGPLLPLHSLRTYECEKQRPFDDRLQFIQRAGKWS